MRLDTRTWALIPLAVATNVTAGWLVGLLKLPLYLDSLGTVLVAALCGPLAGALTGVLSNSVSAALWNPAWLAFVPVSALIGVLASFLARRGLLSSPGLAALAGLLVGVASAFVSAPISAWVFGGTTGGGTDVLVALFRAAGFSRLEASVAQSLASDPLDKMVTFLVIQAVLASLPTALRARFPQGDSLGPLRGRSWSLGRRAGGHGERREAVIAAPPSLYREGAGWLHRRAPFTKVLLVLAVAVAAFALPVTLAVPEVGLMPGPALPLLAALLLGLALVSGVGLEVARATAVTGLPLGLSMVLVNGLFGPERALVLGYVPWSWAGAVEASGMALRVLAILEASLILLITTRADVLMADLERRGLPHKLAYAGLASLNLLPTMLRRAAEIREAQTARGLAMSRGLAGLVPLAGPLLLGSLAEVEERAMALEARGFGAVARRTWLYDPPGTGLDLFLQVLLVAAMVAVVLA